MKPVPVDAIMRRDPVKIEATKTISDAVNAMKSNNVGKLVVTVNGRPSVIIEEWRVFSLNPVSKISEVLDRFQPVTTIPSGTPLDEAKRLLADKAALVVTGNDPSDILGIVTIEDFIGFLKRNF